MFQKFRKKFRYKLALYDSGSFWNNEKNYKTITYKLQKYREEDENINMNPIENLKDLIIYQSQNKDNISVEVLYDKEDFWLTQKSMSKLFEVEVNTINYHLKEIFKSGELIEEAVIRKIRITANDGKIHQMEEF